MNRLFWQGISQALAPSSYVLAQTGSYPRQAAVMVLVTDAPSPEIIYTLRAKHLNQHPGEVCFPGGKWEPQDSSLLTTALRETHEEIGIAPAVIDVLGALPARSTRSGASVQPFVGRVPASCRFTLNHHELEELFRVPLEAFRRGLQVRMDTFDHNGDRIRIPAYLYEKFEIWGFTAGVTADFLACLHSLPLDAA